MTEDKKKEIQTIEKQGVDAVAQASALTISNQADYDGCANVLRSIKGLKKEIDNTFDESIKKAHETHKTMVSAKKKHYEPLDEAEKIIKGKSIEWYNEEQRKQREEQARVDEEARKEQDRKRKIKEEQERVWREKEDAKRKEAQRLEDEGKAEEARKAREAADAAAEKADTRAEEAEEVFVPAPIVENRAEKAGGQSISKTWVAEVTSLFALCNAIAKGELPVTCVKADMTKLNALARTWEDSKSFDGVKFFPKQTMSVRG